MFRLFGFRRKRRMLTSLIVLALGATVVPGAVKSAKADKVEKTETIQATQITASAMSRDEKLKFINTIGSEETLAKVDFEGMSDEELNTVVDNVLSQVSDEDIEQMFGQMNVVMNKTVESGAIEKMMDFLQNRVMPAAFKSGLYETMFKAIGVDTESEEYQKLYEMGVNGGNFND